jgi:hypothetical protein
MAEPPGAGPNAALDKLAAELNGGDYVAGVVAHAGRRPYVHVRNRHAGVLTENIYAGEGWFWFGWAERIAPVTDVAAAAEIVIRVLRAVGAAGQ